MTLEEKIQHLQDASMEEARAEGNAIIKDHSNALEQIFSDHTEAATRQAELTIKAETSNAKQELNKAMAKSQIDLKREQGACQTQLKDQLFTRVNALLSDYMKTESYTQLLCTYIQEAMKFANGETMTIYINPTDESKQNFLQECTGASLTISKKDFVGGLRAVIHERNILIDRSFQSALAEEYDKFLFIGGSKRD